MSSFLVSFFCPCGASSCPPGFFLLSFWRSSLVFLVSSCPPGACSCSPNSLIAVEVLLPKTLATVSGRALKPCVRVLSSCCPLLVQPCAPFLSSWCPSAVLWPRWQTLCPPLVPKAAYLVIVPSRLCLFCWPRRLVRVFVSCLAGPCTLLALLPQSEWALSAAWPHRFFFIHRLVQVCVRVGRNATVMQRFKFDIILGFLMTYIYIHTSRRFSHVTRASGTVVVKPLLFTCRSPGAGGYRL